MRSCGASCEARYPAAAGVGEEAQSRQSHWFPWSKTLLLCGAYLSPQVLLVKVLLLASPPFLALSPVCARGVGHPAAGPRLLGLRQEHPCPFPRVWCVVCVARGEV